MIEGTFRLRHEAIVKLLNQDQSKRGHSFLGWIKKSLHLPPKCQFVIQESSSFGLVPLQMHSSLIYWEFMASSMRRDPVNSGNML
jgi:hypothetical protein